MRILAAMLCVFAAACPKASAPVDAGAPHAVDAGAPHAVDAGAPRLVDAGAPHAVDAGPPLPPPPPGLESALRAPDLKLPDDAIAGTLAYARHVEAFNAAPSDDAFCALLGASVAAGGALDEPLNRQRGALWNGPAEPLDAFVAALKPVSDALVGLDVEMHAGGVTALRNDDELAALLPEGPSREAVARVGALVTMDFPAWARQVTDEQGCLDPKAATAALVAARKPYEAASACLRDLYKPQMTAEVEEIASWRWICEESATLDTDIDALANALATWTDEGGADAAALLRKAYANKRFRFGLVPP